MLVGFKAKNHPQQNALDSVDDRTLPMQEFDLLNQRFHFTIDVAASADNRRLGRHYTKDQDGITQSWANERVYCNPPYSNIAPWIEKAWLEADQARLIVMLLPANRTEQKWWQDYIEPKRDRSGSTLRVEFLSGRTRFIKPGDTSIKPNNRPPFGCCLCIWNHSK